MNRLTLLFTAAVMLLGQSARAEAVSDPNLVHQLEGKLRAYAQSLQSGDHRAVLAVLSMELQTRIAVRGPGATFDEHLAAFMQREQKKLAREVEGSAAQIAVTQIDSQDDGNVLAVSIALNGRAVPKPVYFVREQGNDYKLNLTAPARQPSPYSTSGYVIENDDYQPRNVSCSGSSTWLIAPYPATLTLGCNNSCPSWFFDGTRVSTPAGFADCDYNTWGTDAYIRSGYPVCNDRC